MYQNKLLGITLTGAACAIVLFAAEPWKNKDSTQWTDDDINKVLTDSPWAKEMTISPQRSGYGQRPGGMGRRGGFGYPGGGYPGGGYPGGGGGYPSGGGGGYPSQASMNVTVRWDSALPVQQALKRQGSASADEAKAVADASDKFYVITVFGFRMPSNRRSGYGSTSSDSDQDRDRQSADNLRSQLLDAAQLLPKSARAIYAQDVQVEGGGSELHFLFPRNPGIASSSKEVDFILDVRGVKVEHKFHLSDMQYQGQLAL